MHLVAYGAVCYARAVDRENHVTCTLVMAKSRLAPQEEISIPTLEPLAAEIAVKLRGFS